MKLDRLYAVAAVLSLGWALSAHASTPAVGQPAPQLNFTALYGAPDGTKTDWPSLRGKVVVLEFWATWCAPCIAEIPQLNQLATSLAGSNIQFVSADDEDPAVVKAFLAKKHMEGWVGVSKQVFDDYGVQARPTTIVIDPQGRVAAVMNPQQLAKDQLVALASGKPVVFAPDPGGATMAAAQKALLRQIAAMKNPSAGAGKALFEFSIRPGDPTAMPITFMNSSSDGESSYDMRNAPLSILIPWAAGVPRDRVVIHGDADKARFNLHLSAPNLDPDQMAPLLEQAITSSADVKLTHQAAEEDAYVLKATAQTGAKLAPTVSNHGSMSLYDGREGKLTMVNASLGDLAEKLEEALGVPVLNETKTPGTYDAGFTFPKGDFEATRAALEANMGLTLVKAKRTIDRVIVDPLTAPEKSTQPAPAAAISTQAPGQQVQTIAVPRQ